MKPTLNAVNGTNNVRLDKSWALRENLTIILLKELSDKLPLMINCYVHRSENPSIMIKSFFSQQMLINKETHNWTK